MKRISILLVLGCTLLSSLAFADDGTIFTEKLRTKNRSRIGNTGQNGRVVFVYQDNSQTDNTLSLQEQLDPLLESGKVKSLHVYTKNKPSILTSDKKPVEYGSLKIDGDLKKITMITEINGDIKTKSDTVKIGYLRLKSGTSTNIKNILIMKGSVYVR